MTDTRARAIHELRASFGFLTILPIGTAPHRRYSTLGLAPVVGAALGAAAAGLVSLGDYLFPSTWGALVVAVLTVAGLAAVTRGLHLDGLADTADGLGRLGSAEVSLAVMRRPDIGPFGVVAVVLVLLLDCAALARDITIGRGAASILVAVVTGRLAMTQAATPGIPAARPDGLGAQVAGSVPRVTAWSLILLALAATAGGIVFAPPALIVRLDIALIAGCMSAVLLRAHVARRIGGITGDTLGALCEVATCACLVATAIH